MTELDPTWKTNAEALSDAISAATGQRYTPRGSVGAQLFNAIGQAKVERVLSNLDTASGPGATGQLVIFTSDHVAVAELDQAPASHAGAADSWRIEVSVVPRASLRAVRIGSEHSRRESVNSAEFMQIAWSSIVTLEYDGLDAPLVFRESEQRKLTEFIPFALQELRGA